MSVNSPRDILVLTTDDRTAICRSLETISGRLQKLFDFADYFELEECGCCGMYHPKDWSGDCRDDAHRLGSPDSGMTIFELRFEIADKFRKLARTVLDNPEIREAVEKHLGSLDGYEHLENELG